MKSIRRKSLSVLKNSIRMKSKCRKSIRMKNTRIYGKRTKCIINSKRTKGLQIKSIYK